MAAPRQSITSGMFADAVAAVRREGPQALRARSWKRRHLTLAEVADLTGIAYSSLRVYDWEARTAREQGREIHRPFPAPRPGGGYVAGQVILWHAGRDQARARGGKRWPGHERYHTALRALVDAAPDRKVTQRAAALEIGVSPDDRRLIRALLREIGAPMPRRATEEEVMPFLTQLAKAGDRHRTAAEVAEHLDNAGLHMASTRVARLYVKAGGRVVDRTPSTDDQPGALESTRWDGLVTQAQIARAYGVSDATVRQACEAGLIWPEKTQNGKRLFDPAKLTHRKDMHRGPVMKGHKLAAE